MKADVTSNLWVGMNDEVGQFLFHSCKSPRLKYVHSIEMQKRFYKDLQTTRTS